MSDERSESKNPDHQRVESHEQSAPGISVFIDQRRYQEPFCISRNLDCHTIKSPLMILDTRVEANIHGQFFTVRFYYTPSRDAGLSDYLVSRFFVAALGHSLGLDLASSHTV